MATVPKGYVFWDVSANKSYAAGKTFPALGNGDYLVPATTSYDGYYQQYTYYTSRTEGEVTYTNCWTGCVQAAYTSKAQKLPFNTIAGKPVRFFSYNGCQFTSCPTTTNTGGTSSLSAITNLRFVSFYNCTKLTSAPALPTGLTSLNVAFYNTKIKAAPSNFASLTSLTKANYCFWNCTLLTSAPDMTAMMALTSAVGMFYGCAALASPPALPANILDIGYMFYGCTALTSGPTIPSQVTSMYGMFWNCTNLAGNIRIESAVIANSTKAFDNTVNQIILLGASAISEALNQIARGYDNVYAGVPASIQSFTAIRGTYDPATQTFTENVKGTFCKLTETFYAPYVTGALLVPPTLEDRNGDPVSVTWHIDTLDGTALTAEGVQLQQTGKLVTVLNLGSSNTSDAYRLANNTKYTYDSVLYQYVSGSKIATLTFSNLMIDVNPTGTAVGFGMEAPDNDSGFFFSSDVNVLGNLEAETINGIALAVGSYLYNSTSTDTITFTDTNCKGKTRIICGTQDAGNPPLRAEINSATGQITVYLSGPVTNARINYICW